MGTTNFDTLALSGDLTVADDVAVGDALAVTGAATVGGTLGVTGAVTGASFAIAAATPVYSAEVTFTEAGAGTYTGGVVVPAGATIVDVIVTAVALWDAATSAALKVGDTDDDGFYAAVDLKATDLLAGESLSFAQAGGKGGAYLTATHGNGRYSASQRTINGIVTSVGAGTAGRTRMTVVYSKPVAASITAATKA